MDLKGAIHNGFTLLMSVALLIAFALPAKLLADPARGEVAAIRAAYVINFAKLTSWPSSAFTGPDDALNFCLFGNDRAFYRQLASFSGQIANGRKIEVAHYYDPKYISRCHVIYIGQSEYRILRELLGEAGDQPILSISDIPEFTVLGGMLELRQAGSNIQFLANRECAVRAQLSISSELLALALNRREAMELGCP